MVTKNFKNGIFSTSINLGSKTPFKDLQTDFDLQAANATILRDAKAHILEIIDFVESLHLEETKKFNLDDFLPSHKKKQLGLT